MPSVAGDETCGNAAVAANAVLREDVRRDVAHDQNQAIPVLRDQLAQLAIEIRPGQETRPGWRLASHRLVTALRI